MYIICGVSVYLMWWLVYRYKTSLQIHVCYGNNIRTRVSHAEAILESDV